MTVVDEISQYRRLTFQAIKNFASTQNPQAPTWTTAFNKYAWTNAGFGNLQVALGHRFGITTSNITQASTAKSMAAESVQRLTLAWVKSADAALSKVALTTIVRDINTKLNSNVAKIKLVVTMLEANLELWLNDDGRTLQDVALGELLVDAMAQGTL